MLARIRFEFSYGTEGSACYDITLPAEELHEDNDWLHVFYEHVDPCIAEMAYSVSFLGVQYM